MSDKKTAPATTPVETTVVLTTAPALAKRLGVKPTYLRRVLRSMERYNDGIHTKYGWDESTPEGKAAIKTITETLHARKGGQATDKALEAKANQPAKKTA